MNHKREAILHEYEAKKHHIKSKDPLKEIPLRGATGLRLHLFFLYPPSRGKARCVGLDWPTLWKVLRFDRVCLGRRRGRKVFGVEHHEDHKLLKVLTGLQRSRSSKLLETPLSVGRLEVLHYLIVGSALHFAEGDWGLVDVLHREPDTEHLLSVRAGGGYPQHLANRS